MQSARRDVARVRQTIGFDLVGLSFDKLGRLLKIDDRGVKTTQRDQAVAAMTKESCVCRKPFEAFRVDFDRVFVTSQVGGASAEPDRVLRGGWIFVKLVLRFF